MGRTRENYQGEYPDPAIVINTTRRWGGKQEREKRKNRKRNTPNTFENN